ncbi:putative signal transducing protein [Arenimonas alkanexedens]
MTPVYNAESELDAQLVQDLLLGSGITAHIFGPNVAGAVPEVPATGLIRVVVEDEDADLARALIKHLETSPAGDDDDADYLLDSQSL